MLGIDQYPRGVPQLSTAVADAEAIALALRDDHGFTPVLWRDAEVTRSRLRAALTNKLRDELGSELTERDRLVIYFAGHGESSPSKDGPEGHLLLADVDPAEPSTLFAMRDLRSLLGELPCRHLLLVLDCCFAGTFRWAGGRVDRANHGPAFRETLDRYLRHRAWQVLVSASHDQTALDGLYSLDATATARNHPPGFGERRVETARHSPFATALLKGLEGAADYTQDGLIVATELELFVRAEVENTTRVHQTPQLYKLDQHDRGEFVFQVPRTELKLAPAPSLALEACPYQGLRPYGASESDRFFGRANPLTVLLGPSAVGKSSLLAAGVVPRLRKREDWTVIETRPGTRGGEDIRDSIPFEARTNLDDGATLMGRVTAWMSAHTTGQLCLVIDRAEDLEMLSPVNRRGRVLNELATLLTSHPGCAWCSRCARSSSPRSSSPSSSGTGPMRPTLSQ